MHYLKRLIFIVSVGMTSFASAEETYHSIDMSLRSYHINDRCYAECTKRYNEKNYGGSISYNFYRSHSIMLGTLKNSFHKTSVYGAVNVGMHGYRHGNMLIRPGIAIGVANGYSDTPIELSYVKDGYVPVLSPNISFYSKYFHANVGALPSANTIVAIFRAGVRF